MAASQSSFDYFLLFYSKTLYFNFHIVRFFAKSVFWEKTNKNICIFRILSVYLQKTIRQYFFSHFFIFCRYGKIQHYRKKGEGGRISQSRQSKAYG